MTNDANQLGATGNSTVIPQSSDLYRTISEALISILVIALFISFLIAGSAQSDVLKKMEPIASGATYMQVRNFDQNEAPIYQEIKDLESTVDSSRQELSAKRAELSQLQELAGQAVEGSDSESSIDLEKPADEIMEIETRIERENARIERLYNDVNLPKNASQLSDNLNQISGIFPLRQICYALCPLDIPPVVIPFYMIFSSGLFGSILFQLIIKVYPETRFSDRKTSSFISRVLLGGAIAVALFVILASGSVILGSAENLSNANRNIYSLASIGVLAGMFSNRVAGWLSSQAEVFLRDGDGTVKKVPSQHSNPAPQP